jgi:hypothetical protein
VAHSQKFLLVDLSLIIFLFGKPAGSGPADGPGIKIGFEWKANFSCMGNKFDQPVYDL